MKKGYRNRSIGDHKLHPQTLMMSYGYDPQLSEGAVKCPIFPTSTFVFRTAEDGKAFFELAYGLRERGPAEEPGLIYSRLNNPDLEILEGRLALWEDAEAALVFCSGMAAISTTLLSFLRPGDVIAHSEPFYGGTDFLVDKILRGFDIEGVGFRAGCEEDVLEQAVKEAAARGRLAMIYVETPANPTNARRRVPRRPPACDEGPLSRVPGAGRSRVRGLQEPVRSTRRDLLLRDRWG
jgi:methionine-gamma-lyase